MGYIQKVAADEMYPGRDSFSGVGATAEPYASLCDEGRSVEEMDQSVHQATLSIDMDITQQLQQLIESTKSNSQSSSPQSEC